MVVNLNTLSVQIIFPLGVGLVYVALGIYVLSSRKPDSVLDRLLVTYLFLTALWDFNLVVATYGLPDLLPTLTWGRLAAYGLILLGVIYWAFARAFLQRPWLAAWGWMLGLVGLLLAVIFDFHQFLLPAATHTWSLGWMTAESVTFILGGIWWALFMGLAAWPAFVQQLQIQSPAHKNRIRYLFISTAVLALGYGLYLTFWEPVWAAGLIITGIGGGLVTYTVVVEDLIDLATGVRRLISDLIVSVVTASIYVIGVYLVQAFWGDELASAFAGVLDPTLSIVLITALVLAMLYTPIRQLCQQATSRFLLGGDYDYQEVIQSYTQVISNRLYLEELANVATRHIVQALQLQKTALFIVDSQSDHHLSLRTLPGVRSNGSPEGISLQKETPITQRLVAEGRALAQYTIDISPQFKSVPEEDRQTLKSLNYEWFVPVQKEGQLLGIFALGAKKSGQPYSAQDLKLLNTLADQTGLALENATLFDRVQRNLEEMTGLKNLMDNVFDSMDNGVITTDIKGKITFYNRAAESILVVRSEDCLGVPYTDALPSLANTIFPNLVRNVATRETRYSDYEIISELPGRGTINLSLSLSPLKDAQDRTQGVTIVMDDLTETKRLQAVHDMFRRYVSPAVVDRLPSDPADLQLGGHRQEVTILFADIRGFTAFSEKLPPEELVDTLNQYLSMAAASILMYEGTLDKFMGDAVMGIFNAPLEQEDHVLRAVRAATAMQRAIIDHSHGVSEERRLSFGVGLHVGEVVVGNVGMTDRMDYTAIGDAVNAAKRIQENTPGGKILISEAVYEAVKNSVNAAFFEEMKLKGREEPMAVYELRQP